MRSSGSSTYVRGARCRARGLLTADEVALLRAIPADFDADGIAEHAAIERETIHDVKAIEYYIKRRLEGTTLAPLSELVHFACTSEDINNLSYALMVRGAVRSVWLPAATALTDQIAALAHATAGVAMLSRTHGQTATPTTVGKELAVLAHRLRRQLARVERAEYLGKINGATGTFGAHTAAVPGTDWMTVSRTFVEGLGLTWNPLTTQIESHDWQAELYADVTRFGRILHNLATDVWTYISLGFFAQAAAPWLHWVVGDAAQDQPHPLRERRGEPRDLGRAVRFARRHARHVAHATRPHRLHHTAQHRRRVWALAARDRQRAPGTWQRCP